MKKQMAQTVEQILFSLASHEHFFWFWPNHSVTKEIFDIIHDEHTFDILDRFSNAYVEDVYEVVVEISIRDDRLTSFFISHGIEENTFLLSDNYRTVVKIIECLLDAGIDNSVGD